MANPENNFCMQGFMFGEVYSSTEYTYMNRVLCGPIWKFLKGTHHLPSSESPGERNEAKPTVGSDDDHIPSLWYFLINCSLKTFFVQTSLQIISKHIGVKCLKPGIII